MVTRCQIALEQGRYAPSAINLRLAAVRRLAYEASDRGLLSPDLAAGIRRVKGAKRLGVRVGNWLSAVQGKTLLSTSAGSDETAAGWESPARAGSARVLGYFQRNIAKKDLIAANRTHQR